MPLSVEPVAFGKTPRLIATYTSPAGVAYTAGDIIGNSATAGSVVPITWDLAAAFAASETNPSYQQKRSISGIVTGARMTIQCASSTVVLTGLVIDLYLFRPTTVDIPFAAGGYPADNAAMNLTAVAQRELIAVIPFVNAKWRNRIGTQALSGDFWWQDSAAIVLNSRPNAPFNLTGAGAPEVRGLLMAQGAWNPLVAQTYTIELDVQLD